MKINIKKYVDDWYIANVEFTKGGNVLQISGAGISHQKALEDAIRQVMKVQKGI